jgi:hypothetical protein
MGWGHTESTGAKKVNPFPRNKVSSNAAPLTDPLTDPRALLTIFIPFAFKVSPSPERYCWKDRLFCVQAGRAKVRRMIVNIVIFESDGRVSRTSIKITAPILHQPNSGERRQERRRDDERTCGMRCIIVIVPCLDGV